MFMSTDLQKAHAAVREAEKAHAAAAAEWNPQRPSVFAAKKLSDTATALANAVQTRDDAEREYSSRLTGVIFGLYQRRIDPADLLPGKAAPHSETSPETLDLAMFADLWQTGPSSVGLSAKGAALVNAMMDAMRGGRDGAAS